MKRLLAFGAVMVALLLAGCSDDGDPEPKIGPTDTSSAASTPTAPVTTGPVEPTLPAEAEGDDAAAAEAFVEFFWETVNYAQATGDVEGLRNLAGRSCSNCKAATDAVAQIYRDGGRLIGGVNRLSGLSVETLFANEVEVFRITFSVINERQRVDMPGTQDDRVNPAGSIRGRMVLGHENGWRVDIFEVL